MTRTGAALCGMVMLCDSLAVGMERHTVHRDESGIILHVPGHEWKQAAGSQGASRWVTFDSQANEGTRVSLQTWARPPEIGSVAQLCDAELKHWRSKGTVEELFREERTVSGAAALAVRFRLASDDDRRLVDTTYLIRSGTVYRISVATARDDAARLIELVASILAGVAWTEPIGELTAPVPFETSKPIAGNVLTVVHVSGPDAPYRYLETLPGAARANRGLPIVLVVSERLSPPVRTFLAKYRPDAIRIVGPPHAELTRAEAAIDAWAAGGTVVVAARNLADAVPAAALALRLDAPLLVAGPDLDARLRALNAARHIVVGAVEVPPELEVDTLLDATAVADYAGGGTYLALCNVAEGRGDEAAVFAAALAGVHDGLVLPISQRVRVHRAALQPTAERPAGFDESSAKHWVAGLLRVAGQEAAVAAAVTGRMRISGAESDRFGRPRVDLNGDGRFDPAEQVRIGSTIRLADRAYAFSVRYQTVFGHPGQGEALLVEPDPELIRRSIRSFVDHLGDAEHLAIVGTPDRIPFAILESGAYFTTLDIKQELATDAYYADLDDDPSLELAVGRVLVSDLERGSAVIATSLAYPRLEGDWLARASLLAPGFADAEGPDSLHWVWPESENLARSIAGGLREAGVECDTFLRNQVKMDDVLASMRTAGWIGHMNHSNETNWGIRPGVHIGSADLPALEGAPIVVDTGCSSGGADLGVPLAATMAGRFMALGAVAYLGNTRPASLGSEVAVQQMFVRLASDAASIGQAYRDGRNLLAHLLEHGHIDPQFGTRIFDPGVYERTWSQFYNLNLFGDPGLVPRLPNNSDRPWVAVRFEETSRPERRRLTVRRTTKERVDPLLMLPAPGQGQPREAHLRTAPGLSYGMVPHFYLHHGRLSPLRSPLTVAPGAWVDVALPAMGSAIGLALVEGPAWADRGFSIEVDPGPRARLRTYVPFVRSTLEEGGGEILTRVDFDVIASGPAGDVPVPQRTIRAADLTGTERRPAWRIGRISEHAGALVEKIKARRYDPWAHGLSRLQFAVANPGSEVLEAARCRITAQRGRDPQCTVMNLPPRMATHRHQVERAFGFLYDLIVNDPLGYLLSGEYAVDLAGHEEHDAVLRLVPTAPNEGQEEVLLVVSDEGRILRVHRRYFGVEEVSHLRWRATPDGEVLSRLKTDRVTYGQPRIINVDYDSVRNGLHLPARITMHIPGIFAQPYQFRPDYQQVEREDDGEGR